MSLNIYVPRDKRFGHLKISDFLADGLKAAAQFLKPELEAICDSTPNEFAPSKICSRFYEGGIKLPNSPLLETLKESIPLEMLKQLVREGLLKYPIPQVIKGNGYISEGFFV